MSYLPYLISNYATGIDRQLQPWLAPDDAFYELFDGYVYRGVTNKRDGYSGFANGIKSTYVESRMVHTISAFATGQTNTGAVLSNINLPYTPISRGSVVVTDGVESHSDNGLGAFPTALAGSIDYTTGIITGFQFNAASATLVTVTFDYHPGLPVMGVMRFYPNNNIPELIVADTKFVNRYDRTTDRLVDISPSTEYSGGPQDFWSWVNYQDAASNPRLLFSNRVNGDVIQQWNGTTVTNYAPTFAGGTLNARQMFEFQDRLILFQTIEAGKFYPRRIRISGFGANCDVFDATAPGAGFIDIPDNTFFFGAAFNRDDIQFFTESSVWLLKYSGNDVTPFQLKKVDGSRGSKAAFSVISYLNRTMAASPRGLIRADGYTVARMDEVLPDFAFNSINNQYFESIFSGFIDEDRDVYMMYPSKGNKRSVLLDDVSSDRILVSNFEEDTYAIYRIPISCMGNFEVSNTLLWSDLSAAKGFAKWDDLAAKYESWNAFPYSKAVPIAIAGGHKGEIWKLTENEIQDNPQPIRSIVKGPGNDEVTVITDWNNYQVGDYIFFTAVQGMTEINQKQGVIKDPLVSNYTSFTVDMGILTNNFSAYTGGGTASRVVPFEALTKKFNPFANLDKKLKCGWIYFYVTCTDTSLTHAEIIDNVEVQVPDTPFLEIDLFMNDFKDITKPSYTYKIDLSASSSDNLNFSEDKKWVKIWINQVGKFLQFRIKNTQAGSKIQIQAMMPGFAPTGRLI